MPELLDHLGDTNDFQQRMLVQRRYKIHKQLLETFASLFFLRTP